MHKRPRREWRIPRIDAYARLLQQQEEEARLEALVAGTTPQAREILRRILWRTEQLQSEGKPLAQIISVIEELITTHIGLQPQFALLLGRLWCGTEEFWRQASPHSFAKLLLSGTICVQNRKGSAADGLTETSGSKNDSSSIKSQTDPSAGSKK